ncbi:hypothetical protein V2J09_002753 [Rumex salicifolius]
MVVHPVDVERRAQKDQLDAGALFVLQSKGSWWHCGYHLTTSIVAPALLSLPYAFTFLGWAAGVASLVIGAAVTFYSYNLLSRVLEQQAEIGNRQLRFRDMAYDILGPKWGKYYVGPTQFLVCYGAVVGCTLLGGQCIKAIYILSKPHGTMKLFECVIIFGLLMLILAQMPSFHSLRHINMGPEKDYSLVGDNTDKLFGVFNAVAIIATTFGNGIIPEIQATLVPPVKGKMLKGLTVCYSVVIATFFSVSISGYWAFGNKSEGQILSNFTAGSNGGVLIPKWFIYMTNAFPTNEVLENLLADPTKRQFSARNLVPRVLSRSASVVVSTTIAAMLPFFGDINAVIGAFGFLPLDFVLPAIFYNVTFKPNRRSFVFWLNIAIAVVFSFLGVLGAIAAVRQISLDAKTYRLFANV